MSETESNGARVLCQLKDVAQVFTLRKASRCAPK
jgi:hypothetical protein